MANSDLIRSAYEAFNHRDINGVAAKLDPHCDWDVAGPAVIPFAGHYHGLSQIGEYAHKMMDALDRQSLSPREFVEQGDMVVVIGREECVVKATGRAYAGEWVHVFRLKAGRIVEAREFRDTAALALAFGAA